MLTGLLSVARTRAKLLELVLASSSPCTFLVPASSVWLVP